MIKPICNVHVRKTEGERYIGITVSNDKYRDMVNKYSTANFVCDTDNPEIISKDSYRGYLVVSECFDFEEIFLLFENLDEEVK